MLQQYSDLFLCMFLGLISLTISLITGVSQLFMTIKTKNTSGVSILTYFFFIAAALISLSWCITYYFKVLISRPPEESIIPPGSGGPQYPYGPYWLWQWGIIPLITNYSVQLFLAIVLTCFKLRTLWFCKKTKIEEMRISSWLLDHQKEKLAKSNNKIWYRKYFWFVIILIMVVGIIVTIFTVWPKFVQPHYNPEYYNHESEWAYVWILGIISAFSFELLSWPQFIKCLKEKNTTGLSLNWAIFLPLGMTISFSYALCLALAPGGSGFPPDTIGALIFNGLIVNYGVLILKIKNIHDAKKHHMTEMQYTKKYLIPAYKAKQAAKAKKKAEKEKAKKQAAKASKGRSSTTSSSASV